MLMMNRLKALGVLICLQIFLLCGWTVSTGYAETVVNIDNKTIDSIHVTVICMECPIFGWGDATPCWDTLNNVSGSVSAGTKDQFKCAAGDRIFIRKVLVRSDRLAKTCSFVPPENQESTWYVTMIAGLSCTPQ
jgi:hypothetical protein